MLRLKSLFEHSGWKVIKAFVAGWLVARIPQWTELVVLPEPWDAIVSDAFGMVAGVIRLLFLNQTDPTVSAKVLPDDVVALLPEQDQAKVEKAVSRSPA